MVMHTEGSASYLAVQWFQQVWRNQDAAAIAQLMSPDAKGHLEGGLEITGPEEFGKLHASMLAAFPDITMELLGVVGENDQACIHWRMKATHTGAGMGMTPTGKAVSLRGMTWVRARDGQLVEGWDCWNQGALFAELSS